jgi:hypothetical protein
MKPSQLPPHRNIDTSPTECPQKSQNPTRSLPRPWPLRSATWQHHNLVLSKFDNVSIGNRMLLPLAYPDTQSTAPSQRPCPLPAHRDIVAHPTCIKLLQLPAHRNVDTNANWMPASLAKHNPVPHTPPATALRQLASSQPGPFWIPPCQNYNLPSLTKRRCHLPNLTRYLCAPGHHSYSLPAHCDMVAPPYLHNTVTIAAAPPCKHKPQPTARKNRQTQPGLSPAPGHYPVLLGNITTLSLPESAVCTSEIAFPQPHTLAMCQT